MSFTHFLHPFLNTAILFEFLTLTGSEFQSSGPLKVKLDLARVTAKPTYKLQITLRFVLSQVKLVAREVLGTLNLFRWLLQGLLIEQGLTVY